MNRARHAFPSHLRESAMQHSNVLHHYRASLPVRLLPLACKRVRFPRLDQEKGSDPAKHLRMSFTLRTSHQCLGNLLYQRCAD